MPYPNTHLKVSLQANALPITNGVLFLQRGLWLHVHPTEFLNKFLDISSTVWLESDSGYTPYNMRQHHAPSCDFCGTEDTQDECLCYIPLHPAPHCFSPQEDCNSVPQTGIQDEPNILSQKTTT